jgi:TolB-like protein
VFAPQLALGFGAFYLSLIMGCAAQHTYTESNYSDGNLVAVGYTIAEKLAAAEEFARSIGPSDPLIVASFVNVNNLEESSGFGRIIAEQITSRFVQRGHKVIELKLRQNSLFVREGQGEFLLSRDIQALSKTYNAAAVVVGTYAEGGDRLYVSARIVRPTDNIIISAYDTGIPMDPMAMGIMLMSR